MYRTVFWTLWEKARVGYFKRTASKHVYHLGWNRSPAQVGCMREALGPDALGRPRVIGWRGREEGGLGWGAHVNPWPIHFNVWQNPLQLKKKSKKKKGKANSWKMVLSLWNKAHAHYLQGNPSGSPSEPADCYFTHNSNRSCIYLFWLLSLDHVVRVIPSFSCIIKSQIPLSNLNFIIKGRVISWKWFTFCGSMFTINKMGMRVPPHKLLGKLSHCM